MHLKELAIIVKNRREVLHITQIDLAELSNISLRSLKSLESGQGNPTFETLAKLAQVLGMELKLEVGKPKI